MTARVPLSAMLVLLGTPACGSSSSAIDSERARGLFTRVPVATTPGLSGLAADERGGIWAVAERDARVYRIVLDAGLRPVIETFAIDGVPARTDLEAIAVLGGGKLALGTEGQKAGVATVLLADQRGPTFAVTGAITLPESSVGIPLAPNHGAEGMCGRGATILVAIEGAGETAGRRWAPVVRLEAGVPVRTHRVWLTTGTGKLSGLDCQLAPDGTATVWAIERHFEVTRILTFTVPPVGVGEDAITPEIALDLGPVLHGRLNLEGIAHTPDGRVITVVDNQWKTITGPSELLVFSPDAMQRAP